MDVCSIAVLVVLIAGGFGFWHAVQESKRKKEEERRVIILRRQPEYRIVRIRYWW